MPIVHRGQGSPGEPLLFFRGTRTGSGIILRRRRVEIERRAAVTRGRHRPPAPYRLFRQQGRRHLSRLAGRVAYRNLGLVRRGACPDPLKSGRRCLARRSRCLVPRRRCLSPTGRCLFHRRRCPRQRRRHVLQGRQDYAALSRISPRLPGGVYLRHLAPRHGWYRLGSIDVAVLRRGVRGAARSKRQGLGTRDVLEAVDPGDREVRRVVSAPPADVVFSVLVQSAGSRHSVVMEYPVFIRGPRVGELRHLVVMVRLARERWPTVGPSLVTGNHAGRRLVVRRDARSGLGCACLLGETGRGRRRGFGSCRKQRARNLTWSWKQVRLRRVKRPSCAGDLLEGCYAG